MSTDTVDGSANVDLVAGQTTRVDVGTIPNLFDGELYYATLEASGPVVTVVREQLGPSGDALEMYEATGVPAPGGPRIVGTVTGGSGPASGVAVRAFTSADGGLTTRTYNETVTDRAGAYALALPAGSYYVQFIAPRGSPYASQLWNGLSAAGTGLTPTAVTLSASDVTVSPTLVTGVGISGRATDALSGGGIAQVAVFAWPSSCLVSACTSYSGTVTDPSGSFRLPVPSGTYRVKFSASAAGYQDQWWNGVTTSAAATDVVAAADVGGINGQLAKVVKASGSVRDASGNAVAGATVSAVQAISTSSLRRVASATTDASGAYSFSVPIGTYRILAVPAGTAGLAATWYGPGASTYATAADVLFSSDRSSLDIAAGAGFIVAGTFGGTGLSSRSVQFYTAAGSCCLNFVGDAAPDASGAYRMGLAAGTYRVFFAAVSGTTVVSKWYANASVFSAATDVPVSGNVNGISLTIP